MEKVPGALVMIMLEMLKFVVLIIIHHLILIKEILFGINGGFGAAGKKFSINFSKEKTKFCLSCYYNNDNSYLLLNGKEIYKFKASDKKYDFPNQFCLESISNKFSLFESKEVCLKGIVYDFSVNYSVIAVDDILDIHKYLIKKNGIV